MNETNHFSMAYTWPWGSQVVDKKKIDLQGSHESKFSENLDQGEI